MILRIELLGDINFMFFFFKRTTLFSCKLIDAHVLFFEKVNLNEKSERVAVFETLYNIIQGKRTVINIGPLIISLFLRYQNFVDFKITDRD